MRQLNKRSYRLKQSICLLILKTFLSLWRLKQQELMRYFETNFSKAASKFIAGLDSKTVKKIFCDNVDLAEQINGPRLFKKLKNDIWEFRTKFAGLQIRLLAF